MQVSLGVLTVPTTFFSPQGILYVRFYFLKKNQDDCKITFRNGSRGFSYAEFSCVICSFHPLREEKKPNTSISRTTADQPSSIFVCIYSISSFRIQDSNLANRSEIMNQGNLIYCF